MESVVAKLLRSAYRKRIVNEDESRLVFSKFRFKPVQLFLTK